MFEGTNMVGRWACVIGTSRLRVKSPDLAKTSTIYFITTNDPNSRAVKLLLNLERIDLSALSLGSARAWAFAGAGPGARIIRKATWMSGSEQIAFLQLPGHGFSDAER